jgi:hypothetical protein
MSDLSETFWALLLTTTSGFVLVALKYCYKSKCSEINLCCITIKRSVDDEMKIDIKEESESKKETI